MNALLAIVLLASPDAQPAEVDAHLAEAQAAFSEQRYDAAADALEAAYALTPQDDILFNWANAERLSGDCDAAVALYDRYLGAVAEDVAAGDEVSARYAGVAQQRREECAAEPEPTGGSAAAEPPPPRVEPAEPTPRPAPPPPGVDEEPKTPWTKDALGWSLTGVGIAAMAAGGGLLGAGYGTAPDPLDRDSHDEYLADMDRAARLEIAGWAVLGTGSAILVGGIVRLALVARRGGRPRAAALIDPRVRF